MGLEIFSITKKMNKAIFILSAENLLHHLDNPKIAFTIVNPSKDDSGKYLTERAYLDVAEVFALIQNLRMSLANTNITDIFHSFKGGNNKKHQCVVSRVFDVCRNNDKILFSVTSKEGEQKYVENRLGQKVPGVVSPKRGGKEFSKCLMGLNRNDIQYIISVLDKELTAWRIVKNFDFMKNPNKYNNIKSS